MKRGGVLSFRRILRSNPIFSITSKLSCVRSSIYLCIFSPEVTILFSLAVRTLHSFEVALSIFFMSLPIFIVLSSYFLAKEPYTDCIVAIIWLFWLSTIELTPIFFLFEKRLTPRRSLLIEIESFGASYSFNRPSSFYGCKLPLKRPPNLGAVDSLKFLSFLDPN